MKTDNSSASAYDAKIEKAETIISEFNRAQSIQKVEEGKLKTILATIGATSESSLAFVTVDDLPPESGMPPVLRRQIIAALQESPQKTERKQWISPRMVDRMSFEQLLGHYNPDEEDAVARKLKDLSKGEAFIVFLPTGGIDVETSTMLLQEIRKGFKGRPNGVIQVGTSFRTIHKIGVNPENYLDENPIYKGRALRPDGTCDQLNRSWAGVDLEMRQLIWLAANDTREMGQITLDKAHAILDIALSKAIDMVKIRYPQAATLLEEKQIEGTLPTLKIKMGKAATVTTTNGNNSPFGKEG